MGFIIAWLSHMRLLTDSFPTVQKCYPCLFGLQTEGRKLETQFFPPWLSAFLRSFITLPPKEKNEEKKKEHEKTLEATRQPGNRAIIMADSSGKNLSSFNL